jgi:hypothetical protein
VFLVLVGLLLVACAAGPDDQINTANAQGIVVGFWRGLWHGAIAPITFVISLFTRNVEIYEIHNNGGWYNFGFMLGINAALGGHAANSRRRRSRVA